MTRRLFPVLVFLFLSAHQAHGQRSSNGNAREVTDRLVGDYMRDQHVPGASVAIAVQGRVVYARGYGWANLEDSVPVTVRTLFPTASTAKLFTATAVLQLIERGKLALETGYRPRALPIPGDPGR